MGNSSIQIRTLVDDARTFPQYAPVLPTGGYSDQPALSITNDVMTTFLMGTPDGKPFNWKFNRILLPTFFLNSYQQDYLISGLVNVGWLEQAFAVYQSATVQPKNIRYMEVARDLMLTNAQTGNVAKACWMQVDTMEVGQWGVSAALSALGLTNPGPGAVYTNPASLPSMPTNPITAVEDTFGNFWTLTQYGTCGSTNPFTSAVNAAGVVFPTLQNQSIVATTVNDGSVIWTAVNPKGQGIRISPQPPANGPVWNVNVVAQQRIPFFTALNQYINPVPDDYYAYFKQGFLAQCARRSVDAKVRATFDTEFKLWIQAMTNAVRQGDRERDDYGFVPGSSIMDSGWAFNPVNPATPYGPWAG
jgi:hypothetical protein